MFLENFSSLVNEEIFALILRDNELNDKLSCHINQKPFWGFGFQKLIIKNWIENVMNFILFYLETKNKVIKLYSKADKKNYSEPTKLIGHFSTYDTPRAAKVPWGMLLKGSFRSPLMLIPAKIPVTVEKNNPIMLKKFSPGRKSGLELLRRLNSEYPITPCSEKNIHKGILKVLIAKNKLWNIL